MSLDTVQWGVSAGGAVGQSPDQVGSVLWWIDASDAAQVTTDVDGIAQIDDKGSLGLNVVQTTGSKKPQHVSTYFGGQLSSEVDNVDDELSATASSAGYSGAFTALYVAHTNALDHSFFHNNGAPSHIYLNVGNGVFYSGLAASMTNGDLAFVDADIIVIFSRDASNNLFVRVNGADVTTATPKIGSGSWTLRGYPKFGNYPPSSTRALATSAFWGVELALSDMEDLEAWAADRFGITLS